MHSPCQSALLSAAASGVASFTEQRCFEGKLGCLWEAKPQSKQEVFTWKCIIVAFARGANIPASYQPARGDAQLEVMPTSSAPVIVHVQQIKKSWRLPDRCWFYTTTEVRTFL
jgi:hypothetical protein